MYFILFVFGLYSCFEGQDKFSGSLNSAKWDSDQVKDKCVVLIIDVLIRYNLDHVFSSVQFSSVAQSCPTLCNPMNHSMPGLPVHHQLPEFTQIHVHRAGDFSRGRLGGLVFPSLSEFSTVIQLNLYHTLKIFPFNF